MDLASDIFPWSMGRPTIEDETVDLSFRARVLEDLTGVLWHNFVKLVFSFMHRGFERI